MPYGTESRRFSSGGLIYITHGFQTWYYLCGAHISAAEQTRRIWVRREIKSGLIPVELPVRPLEKYVNLDENNNTFCDK
jgi:hypothetical protein